MRVAVYLSLLALAPLAEAQQAESTRVQLTSISVSAQTGEVRIEIATSAPVAAPSSVVSDSTHLRMDLPDVAYEKKHARRIVVGLNGVRDVRVWLQSEEPPLTRIAVELDRSEPYLVETDTNGLVLRIGPAVPGAMPPASGQAGKGRSETLPAGREQRGAVWAGGAIVGIFRRTPKQPAIAAGAAGPANPTASQPSSATLAPSPDNNVELEDAAKALALPKDAPVARTAAPPTVNQAPPEISVSSTRTSALPASESAQTLEPSAVHAAISGNLPLELERLRTAPAEAVPNPKQSENFAPKETTSPTGSFSISSALKAEPSAPVMESSAASFEPKVGGRPITAEEVERVAAAENANLDLRTIFHVKFVQQDAAYIDGGRSSGLAEGMKLVVKDSAPGGGVAEVPSGEVPVADLVVIGLAETSAVTEIRSPKRTIALGDTAYLSSEATQALVQQHALGAKRKYPAVISFTEGGDALDEEARVEVPRPPLPSVNRARGRIGFDYMGTKSLGALRTTSGNFGAVFRADFTRIGGTYWNLNGYWRGRLESHSSFAQPTLQDLINRTYHLALTYDNPNAQWVAGFGRLYLPWASSLDTIDGGYFGRRFRPGFITGVFAGSTPDPTSWNYNPNRQLGGTFANLEGGSFDSFHYSSTAGVGIGLLKWQIDRPFIFFEDSITYRRDLSVYESLQADSPSGNSAVSAPGPGIGRSFFTVRWSVIPHVQLNLNHTYFRDIPTFDPQLIGTGLLDRYLFQGFSAGARVDIVKQISVYTDLGRSHRTGDSQSSLNQMCGLTFGRLPWVDLRADVRYSRFNSSFGAGSYRAVMLARSLGERFTVNFLAGDQTFSSALAANQSARFITMTSDMNLGASFFLEGSVTAYRGQLQSYNQWLVTLGYRFDSKWKRK